MVQDVVHGKLPINRVAAHYGVSEATVRKWGGRFLPSGRHSGAAVSIFCAGSISGICAVTAAKPFLRFASTG
jgi:transposase-like protein